MQPEHQFQGVHVSNHDARTAIPSPGYSKLLLDVLQDLQFCASRTHTHTHTPAGPASSNRLARRPRWARENSRPISPRLLAAPERPRALAPPIARKCRRGVGPIQLALRVTDVGGRARLERANVCTPPHGFPALCSQSSPPSR